MKIKKKNRVALVAVLATVTALNVVFRLVTGTGDSADETQATPTTDLTDPPGG